MKGKKIIVVALVGYGLYKVSEKIVLSSPGSIAFDMSSASDKNFAARFVRRLAMKCPYTGFCEITGCRYEIHATTGDSFEQAMTTHLQEGHTL